MKNLNIPTIKWYHYLLFPFYKTHKSTDGNCTIFCKIINKKGYIFKEHYGNLSHKERHRSIRPCL